MEGNPLPSTEIQTYPAPAVVEPLPSRVLVRQSAMFLGIAYGISIVLALAYRLAFTQPMPASDLSAESAASLAGKIGGFVVSILCMMAPLVATIACQLMDGKRPLRGIGVSWKVNRWWFAAWLSVPALVAMSIFASLLMPGNMRLSMETPPMRALVAQIQALAPGNIPPTPAMALVIVSVVSMLAGATVNAVAGFFEEIGWRGYWLSMFRGRSFFLASIVIGALWGLWHAPLILATGHNYPDHPVAGCVQMVVLCAAMGTVIQYFRVKSGSVLVASIFHGTMNALAGTALVVLENFSNFFGGAAGVAGSLASLLGVAVLFAVDRFVTGDRIMTGKLDFRA